MSASKNDRTSLIVDAVLNFAITSGAITAGVLLPGLMIGLEKPLNIFWKKMDKRSRERELRSVVTYMKSRNLIAGDYEHGLQITNKGRKRLQRIELNKLHIRPMKKWDEKWRLVFFDIPESSRNARVLFTRRLRGLGFYQLQKSAWIHPLPCRNEVERISSFYEIDGYVSYVEVTYIDNQEKLIRRFRKYLK